MKRTVFYFISHEAVQIIIEYKTTVTFKGYIFKSLKIEETIKPSSRTSICENMLETNVFQNAEHGSPATETLTVI